MMKETRKADEFMNKKLIFALVLGCINVFLIDSYAQGVLFEKTLEEKSGVVKKASAKLEKDDIAGALAVLDEAVARKKDLLEVYRKRAFIREYYVKDFQGAVADLTEALEIQPDNTQLYLFRAGLKMKLKDKAGALADFEAAQKLVPANALLVQNKAKVKALMNDLSGAEAEIQAGLKIIPDNFGLHLTMTDIYEEGKQPDKAFAYLQAALDDYVKKNGGTLPSLKGERVKKSIPAQFKTPDSMTKELRVRRYSQMDFNARTPQELQKQMEEIENLRTLAEAFIRLATMNVIRRDNEKAFANLQKALEVDRNQEEAYSLRGAIYLSKGEFVKAIEEFDNAISIADEPSYYLNRGMAHLETGNEKKARADFDKFLMLYPTGQPLLDERLAEFKKRKANK